ncbi:uncharacterized protein TNCV_4889161 [Trichonephila clavipes]|nr:uncharacterized protein TNCV_4889161 [Trichonephila clavipes]
MLIIIIEIGEIRKLRVYRVMAEMIIGVTTRMAVKEISGSTAGIDFRRMIENLTTGDTNLEMGGQKDNFSRGDHRNRGSSGNFSRGDRRQRGRLNVLKVSDVQSDQTQSANDVLIELSAICMSLVELPCVSILLNDTFTKALWESGTEKSFISEETYRKYFFYKQVKKLRTQVITAQGAKCQNIVIVELNVRIREFEKPWLLYVLADLECPCIIGVDFISGSKIILPFDRKSLAIPDSQIDTMGLFSDIPGLTHVLYHDIDTGDKTPIVSRPYRYYRVKQVVLDYHVDKMLKEGTIIPIQSPYASPVVICKRNNGLPPDNPEAYKLAVDYRNLNAISKYLSVIPFP